MSAEETRILKFFNQCLSGMSIQWIEENILTDLTNGLSLMFLVILARHYIGKNSKEIETFSENTLRKQGFRFQE